MLQIQIKVENLPSSASRAYTCATAWARSVVASISDNDDYNTSKINLNVDYIKLILIALLIVIYYF